MIRNEEEYREAVQRMGEERKRLNSYIESLRAEGLDSEQIKRLTDPIASFHQQLVDDIRSYERLKQGDFDSLQNLHGIGRMLIGIRIYLGLSQAELAAKVGTDPSQVSRDERNEYHNISVSRASKIFDALGVKLTSNIEIQPQGDPNPEASAA